MNARRQILLTSLIERITCVTRTVNSGKSFPFNKCTLSQTEARILMYIAQSKDGISVKELAAALQVTSGAVTQTVDGLVENGLVTRRESKSDRRVLQIILTSQARKKVDAFQKQYIQDIAPVFETLNNTEITQLTTLLTKVSNLKEKEVNKRNE